MIVCSPNTVSLQIMIVFQFTLDWVVSCHSKQSWTHPFLVLIVILKKILWSMSRFSKGWSSWCVPLALIPADDTTPSPQPDSPVKPGSGAEGLVETHQDTAGEKQEEEEEDDPCCSERLLQFMIRNFSQLNDQVLSDPVFIRNLPWYEHLHSKNRPLGTVCQQWDYYTGRECICCWSHWYYI